MPHRRPPLALALAIAIAIAIALTLTLALALTLKLSRAHGWNTLRAPRRGRRGVFVI